MNRTDDPRAASRDRAVPHEAAWLALPWLANGTLEGDEAAGIEAHALRCAECREELARERLLREELRHAAAVSPAPHPVQLARLWESIDGTAEPASPSLLARSRSGLARWPRGARWLVAAQAAMILLLLALGARVDRQRPAGFRTLGTTPRESVTARVRVVFADTLDQRGLRDILLPLGAEIVAGPSPLGVYTLVLRADAEPLGWVLTNLRARPEVRFAEPVRDEAGP